MYFSEKILRTQSSQSEVASSEHHIDQSRDWQNHPRHSDIIEHLRIYMSQSNKRPLGLPAVVACGYRRVQIPKSGNTFPALLVAFEAETEEQGGNDSLNTLKPLRFVWRSKKDFLLLARKGVESNEKSLPKAAFKKIVDETAVPWRRPSEETKKSMEQTRLNKIAIPDCLSNEELLNHYTVKMKKSILQLDTFLQTMEKRANESAERQTAWDFFSRDSNTEDLVPLETTSSVQGSNSASSPSPEVALRESSRLGQYFASKENARKVADLALEKTLVEYHRDPNPTDWTKMVFVEPSCGHGDIILSLIDSMQANHFFCPDYHLLWIIGFDIDPAAIEICRKRKEFRPICTRTFAGNQHETHICQRGGYTIFLECSSFFDISPDDCVRRLQQYHHEIYRLPEYKSEVFRPASLKGFHVCCLGGPPYTTGQGSGSAMKRDLPERFVDHCYNKWKACVICFLLPARYRDDSCVSSESAFLAINPPSGQNHGKDDDAWIRETHELEASTFFFRGTAEVTQPSIIKRLYRSQTSDDGYFGYEDGKLIRVEDEIAQIFKHNKA